jgi:hypothetical protein
MESQMPKLERQDVFIEPHIPPSLAADSQSIDFAADSQSIDFAADSQSVDFAADSQSVDFDILSQVINYDADLQPFDEHWFMGNAPKETPTLEKQSRVRENGGGKMFKSKIVRRKTNSPPKFVAEKMMQEKAENVARSSEVQKKEVLYPGLILQPMLATSLLLCGDCSSKSRGGKCTQNADGTTSMMIVMCDLCIVANTKIRYVHRKEILPRCKVFNSKK